jgi:hypothetical protein
MLHTNIVCYALYAIVQLLDDKELHVVIYYIQLCACCTCLMHMYDIMCMYVTIRNV